MILIYVGKQVSLGDPVTVSWTGQQSHSGDIQDWDWIAGFQTGACNATGIVGEDTCYSANEWAWVSDQGGSSNGSWTFTFDGPGLYEFRISYCGCDSCNDITGDFTSCDGYQEVGVSAAVNVLPPVDVSSYGPDVQFALGLLWVEFEGLLSAMQQVLGESAPQPSCNSCFCSMEDVIKGMQTSLGDFRVLWKSFSMTQLESTIGDIASTIVAMKDAFGDCDVDAIAGKQITEDVMLAAAGLVSGLGEVEDVVKMVLDGETIYSYVSNALLGWEQGNMFASGVNTAKLLNILLSTSDLKDSGKLAVVTDAASAAGVSSMARRPGGEWVPCANARTAVCINLTKHI